MSLYGSGEVDLPVEEDGERNCASVPQRMSIKHPPNGRKVQHFQTKTGADE